jgi:hypothetical protein
LAFDEKRVNKEDREAYLLGQSLVQFNETRAWKFIKQFLLDHRFNISELDTDNLTAEQIAIAVKTGKIVNDMIDTIQTEIRDAINTSNEIKMNNS